MIQAFLCFFNTLDFILDKVLSIFMKKVVSVRLREEIVAAIDEYSKKYNIQSRTDFLKKALEYFIKNHRNKNVVR